jgi:hypothetical protein
MPPSGHMVCMGHRVQLPAPSQGECVPGLHGTAYPLADPCGHSWPGGQGLLQAGVVRPDCSPKVPSGQGVHAPAPPRLYVPGPHAMGVGYVLPGAHAYPAVHGPLHLAELKPGIPP